MKLKRKITGEIVKEVEKVEEIKVIETPEVVIENETVIEIPEIITPVAVTIWKITVDFIFASYALNENYKAELNQVAEKMKVNPSITILVIGYTDEIGGIFANIILSRNRANAVKTYLVSKGVSAGRIKTKGLGKTVITLDDGRTGMFRVAIIKEN